MDLLDKEVENILNHFEEISRIPRESEKEEDISNYILNFAEGLGCDVYQDDLYNLIIKKKSAIPNYNGPTVALQGHMDMVYEKKEDSKHVYEKGIDVINKDGYLYADGTTLGADNGIAVAYFLKVLESNNIKHPDLEIIITAQEEVGLVGAEHLDVSSIESDFLINMDAEEEGVFFTSCAGGMRSYIHIPSKEKEIKGYSSLKVNIGGLKGGHSGLEIDQERGNAIKLLGRLLYQIDNDDVYLESISAPGKANAIPANSSATIIVKEKNKEKIISKIDELEKTFKKELEFTDNVSINISEKSKGNSNYVYTQEVKETIINALMLIPSGVINKSFAIPGLVQTSTNIGSLEESKNKISILSSSRSSIGSQKYNIANQIKVISDILNIEYEFFNDYPEWEYKSNSQLQEIVGNLYEKTFDKEPTMTAIHAGLECGYFANKLDKIDIISFGPNLYQVHTPEEHASIESIKNIWLLLKKLLEEMATLN